MAWAICVSCGQGQSWSARRGSKLAGRRCAHCGGRLKGASMRQIREQRQQARGRDPYHVGALPEAREEL